MFELPVRRRYRIVSVVDAGAAEAITRDALTHGDEIEAFVGTYYARAQIANSVVWASTRGHGGDHCILTRDGNTWFAVNASAATAPRNGVRLARELLRRELAAMEGFPVHGSAATLDKRASLFVGSSGGGKSTLALEASRSGGFHLSGDQTEIYFDGKAYIAVGFPTIARFGHGTLAAAGLEHIAETAPFIREQPARVGMRIGDAAKMYVSPLKIEVTQTELEAFFSAPSVAAAELGAIVFLAARFGREPVTRVVTPDQAIRLLHPEVRVPDPAFRNDWLALDAPRTRTALTPDALAKVLARVPCIYVEWDPMTHDALRILDEVRKILAARDTRL